MRDGARHGPSAIRDFSLPSSASPAGTVSDSTPGCRRDQTVFLSHSTTDRRFAGTASIPRCPSSSSPFLLRTRAGVQGWSLKGRLRQRNSLISVSAEETGTRLNSLPGLSRYFLTRDISRGTHPQHQTGQESPCSCRVLATSAFIPLPTDICRAPQSSSLAQSGRIQETTHWGGDGYSQVLAVVTVLPLADVRWAEIFHTPGSRAVG